jgi:hypothetical protein
LFAGVPGLLELLHATAAEADAIVTPRPNNALFVYFMCTEHLRLSQDEGTRASDTWSKT